MPDSTHTDVSMTDLPTRVDPASDEPAPRTVPGDDEPSFAPSLLNLHASLPDLGRSDHLKLATLITFEQLERWRRGDRLSVEGYLIRFPGLRDHDAAVLELILGECTTRRALGEQPTREEYQRRFPRLASALALRLESSPGVVEDLPPTFSTSGGTQPPAGLVGNASPYPVIPGYEISQVIGRGGMGVVYRAVQLDLRREVALKMIRDGDLASPEKIARFRAEAEAVAALDHPNIIRIYHSGEYRGLHFFAMELLEKGSLAELLRQALVPIPRAAQLLETLARATHYAHEQQIVHRDLKPANILMTAAGVPKITDFGIARRLDIQLGLTHNGDIRGTAPYMAPEQASGSRGVGVPADVYALGAILYELLTGVPPFKCEQLAQTLDQIRHQPPRRPTELRADIPADLETICLKCLEKEPPLRYGSARALAEDLARFLCDLPIEGRATSVDYQVRVQKVLSNSSIMIRKPWFARAGYELRGSPIGRDGRTHVYHARQVKTDRTVYLKVLLPGAPADEQRAHRTALTAEAERLARLRHPLLTPFVEIGEQEEHLYFAVAKGSGVTLEQTVLDVHLPAVAAVELLEQLSGAVDYAHQHHVLHRNLKPNLVLLDDRQPWLTCFGLINPTAEVNNLSQSQTPLMLRYLAPEQAAEEGEPVGVGCDIYALGAILYELFTGKPPVNSLKIGEAYKQLFQLEPPPPFAGAVGVYDQLNAIALKCLRKDPRQRYLSAAALTDDLRRARLAFGE